MLTRGDLERPTPWARLKAVTMHGKMCDERIHSCEVVTREWITEHDAWWEKDSVVMCDKRMIHSVMRDKRMIHRMWCVMREWFTERCVMRMINRMWCVMREGFSVLIVMRGFTVLCDERRIHRMWCVMREGFSVLWWEDSQCDAWQENDSQNVMCDERMIHRMWCVMREGFAVWWEDSQCVVTRMIHRTCVMSGFSCDVWQENDW